MFLVFPARFNSFFSRFEQKWPLNRGVASLSVYTRFTVGFSPRGGILTRFTVGQIMGPGPPGCAPLGRK